MVKIVSKIHKHIIQFTSEIQNNNKINLLDPTRSIIIILINNKIYCF